MVPRVSGLELNVAITGAGRGIGLATARRLAARGARVAIGDLDSDAARAAAAGVDGAVGLELDVRDRDSFERFLAESAARLGPLDVIVNNAGVMPLGAFLDESDESTWRQLEVNLWGVIVGTRAALGEMVARGSGQIVNVASMGGRVELPGAATYTATKAGVIALTEALRAEVRGSGVTLTTVMPAMVKTELADGVPRGRGLPLVTPEQVAEGIVDAIEHRRQEVYVPGWIGYAGALKAVAPRAAVELVRRAMNDRRVLEQLDDEARAGYEQRVAGSGDSARRARGQSRLG
jgi:short-subunit dehydrogenase